MFYYRKNAKCLKRSFKSFSTAFFIFLFLKLKKIIINAVLKGITLNKLLKNIEIPNMTMFVFSKNITFKIKATLKCMTYITYQLQKCILVKKKIQFKNSPAHVLRTHKNKFTFTAPTRPGISEIVIVDLIVPVNLLYFK